jgi:outer membrane protein assembly factor BamB
MRQIFFLGLVLLVASGCCRDKQPDASNTPEAIWKTPLSNDTETATMNPIVYKNLVIYCANDGNVNKSKLVALNRNDGKFVWELRFSDFDLGSLTSSRWYIYNNILYIPILKPYRLVAVNLDSGSKVWQTNASDYCSWQIVGDEDKIYHLRGKLDKTKDYITKVDPVTGDTDVIYTLENNGTPVFINDLQIYKDKQGNRYLAFLASVFDNQYQNGEFKMIKYSIDSNKIVYEKSLTFLNPKAQYALANYYNGKFWLGGLTYQLYAVDEQTGNKSLEIPVPVTNQSGKMLAIDDKLFITTEQIVYCYNANTGSFLWKEEGRSGGSPSRLTYHKGVLYFTSAGDGKFHAIDGITGKSIYDVVSPDKKSNGQGSFDTAITIDSINDRVYTASYFSAICYKTAK